jgi:subtilisin family serine protease
MIRDARGRRGLATATLLTAALLVAVMASPAPATATEAAGTQPAPEAAVAPGVDRTIVADGHADVVVELRTGVPDQPAPDPASAAGRRAALERASRDFVQRLPDGVEARTDTRDSRYVALRVDREGADALREDPRVVSVAINGRRTVTLANSAPATGAPVAWQNGFTGAGHTVAILDTGVRANHQFVSGRVVDGACFSGGGMVDPTLVPLCPGGTTTGTGVAAGAPCVGVDLCEHGTHVAGIAAGANGPASAPNGVAPGANIVAIQVYTRVNESSGAIDLCGDGGGSPSSCLTAFDADILAALDWVMTHRVTHNIVAANLSLGGTDSMNPFGYPGNCDATYPNYASRIDALRAAGVATVAASGNQGWSNGMDAPACVSGAISVGATASLTSNVVGFSNSSPTLDLLAPGATSSAGSGISSSTSTSTSSFASIAGTSMSAPHVVGAFALLRQADPTRTVAAEEALLEQAGRPVVDGRTGRITPALRVDNALFRPPYGSFDSVVTAGGGVRARGWAIDPDVTTPILVHAYVDGVFRGEFAADVSRPDVGAAFPGFGATHGFDLTVPASPGPHVVCVYGINQGHGSNALIGCRTVTRLSGSPFGSFDSATSAGGSVRAQGWAIDPDVSGPILVHAYVDGVFRGEFTADASRPDVGAAFPGFGAAHGFDVTVSASPGSHTVCVYGINQAQGGHALVGCRSVVTPTGNPFGSVDSMEGGPGNARLRGWVIDPDTSGPVKVHVYVDNTFKGEFTANGSRPDVGATFPGYGSMHGFDITIPTFIGFQQVRVFAINVGSGANPLLRSQVIVVGGDPYGSVDGAVGQAGGLRASGWAIDRDTADSTKVHVYVDGAFRGEFAADEPRADVGAAFPAYGALHGYTAVVSAAPGNRQVCVYAINLGWGGHALIACRTVRVT